MSVEFIADRGYKLCKEGRSLILSVISIGKEHTKLTDKQVLESVRIAGAYLDKIANRAPLDYKRIAITPAETPPLQGDSAYKFTDDSGLRYWLDGDIRLTPLSHYHVIENELARDEREGFGMVHLQGPIRFADLQSSSGHNALIICTSSDARKSERNLRHIKFGKRLLKINRLTEFTKKIADLAGATRYAIRDMSYSDVKVVRAKSELPDLMFALNGLGDLKQTLLEYLADNHLDELIRITEAASAFTKPNSFREERERRLLFAMGSDVSQHIAVKDKSLAEHIELIV
jgi:hypothetical protein